MDDGLGEERSTGPAPTGARRALVHALVLVGIAAPLYFARPLAIGLYTTQESIRVNVAREMQRADQWLVPVRRGVPYLAKPPMIYWCERASAGLRGDEVRDIDGRIIGALFGVLGVLATYFAGRGLLRGFFGGDEPAERVDPDRAAFLGALALCVGVLWTLQSRVGEIDILLGAPVIVAMWGMHASWVRSLATHRVRWGALAVATLAAVFAGLTKGPPPLAVIAVAGPGSVPARWLLGGRERSLFRQLEAMHPILVLGVPVVVLWGLKHATAARVGADVAARMTAEIEDNLTLFDPHALLANLGSAGVTLGLFGVFAFCVLAKLIARARRRPRTLSPGAAVLGCTVVLGFIMFSVTTKGIARYMLPLWPALALLAGAGMKRWCARGSYPLRRPLLIAAMALIQGGALLWWSGWGRVAAYSDRCPREFCAELLAAADPSRVGTLDFNADAIDVYLGQPVEAWGHAQQARPVEELVELIKRDPRPYTLLVLGHDEASAEEIVVRRLGDVQTRVIPILAPLVKPPDQRIVACNVWVP